VRKIACNLDEVDPLYARPLPVEAVTYNAHYKPGRPASLRISYRLPDRWLSEWLCLFHPGYAGEKARAEWFRRGGTRAPVDINDAVRQAQTLRRPPAVVISNDNGFPNPVPVWD
jgi:DNA repair protein RadD